MLLREAERFLTQLLANSETLDPAAHNPVPELTEPELDEAGLAWIAEFLQEYGGDNREQES